MLSHTLPAARLCLLALLLTGCGHRGVRPPASAAAPPAQVAVPADPDGWHQVNGDSSLTRYSRATLNPPLRLAWRQAIPTPPVPPPYIHYYGPQIAYGSTVYVSYGWKFFALDTPTGHILWSQQASAPDIALGAPPSQFATATRFGLVYSDKPNIVGLSGTDGHVLFRKNVSYIGYDVLVGPVVPLDDSRVVTSGKGMFIVVDNATGQSLDHRKINYQDQPDPNQPMQTFGAEPFQIGVIPGPNPGVFARDSLWLYSFEGGLHGRLRSREYIGPNAVTAAQAGHIILFTSNIVYSEDLSLKTQWTTSLPPSVHVPNSTYPLVVTPKYVVVGDWRHLYGLDAATGRRLWTAPWNGVASEKGESIINTDGMYFVPPVAAGQVLYALSRSGSYGPMDSVTAYSVSTGRVLWTGRVGSDLRSLIVHDGALYVGDEVSQNGKPLAHFLIKLTSVGQTASTAK